MSISVLISVYKSDSPAYFDRALQSVWDDQTLKPDEIVLIEDGPLGDGLRDVVDKWAVKLGERLRLIVNEKNLGLTASLNKGIDAARGTYIARMDSDDISMPERFRTQYDFMEAHRDVAVVGSALQEIDENDNWGALRTYPSSTEKIYRYIVKANPLAHPTTFIRAEIFREGFRYDERYRKNQDLKLWFDLLGSHHKMCNLSQPLLYFRRTSDTYRKRASNISLRSELRIYLNGISCLYGKCSWKKIYPLVRYTVKSMPPGINRFVYKYLFKKNNK